jgi:lipopolysaccharide export LptBFGC system permease protein LptF
MLARVCSAETMSRVVDPIFADMRWEDGRATVLGCASLAKALAVHAITSVPGWGAALWADDDYAMPKAAAFVIATALIAAVPLLAPPLVGVPRHRGMSPMTVAVTLLPQALALTLPASLLVAIPLALSQLSGRLIRRTLLLSTVVVAANYLVVVHAVPDANQSFREAAARTLPATAQVNLVRGPMEMHLSDLRRQIDDLKRTRGGEASARRLEYTYQLRLAIVAAAIPLAVAGLVVAPLRRGSRRVLLAIGILVAYWALMASDERAVQALIDSGGFIPEYLCAWTPNAILLIVSCAILAVRHTRIRPSTVTAA